MEYESSEAKRLVEMLETSEAQEKEYILRRTRRLVIIWSIIFLLVVSAVTFIILGFSQRSKYVAYDLHYVKYLYDENDKGAGREVIDQVLKRKANIYETIGNIEPPPASSVEGFNFTEKYYNSSNYEVEVDPDSNIAQSLTYEKAIYMQYTLGHYHLTIQTDATSENRFSTNPNNDKDKKGAIGYNKKLSIAPANVFDNAEFYQRYKAYQKDKTVTYIGNNFLNLYALHNATIDENEASESDRVKDYDGVLNQHIMGFYYYHNNTKISYTLQEVLVKMPDGSIENTYLVSKTIGDKKYTNLSNGWNIQFATDKDGNITDKPVTQIEAGETYYIATTKLDRGVEDANSFYMPGKDTIVTIQWETDDRSMVIVDTLDGYTWDNFVFRGYDLNSIKNYYSLTYDQVSRNVESAKTDGIYNDWDEITDIFKYSDREWSMAVVISQNTFADYNVLSYVNEHFKDYDIKEDSTLTNKGGGAENVYYYPVSKAGYKRVGWQIWIKNIEGGGSWVDVSNTTKIEDKLSTCIMVRPKWEPENYVLRFGKVNNPLGTMPDGYTRPGGNYQINYSIEGVRYNDANGLVARKEQSLVKGIEGSSTTDLYVSKTGYKFIGWQLEQGQVLEYNSTAGGKLQSGYTTIGSNSTEVAHVIAQTPYIEADGEKIDPSYFVRNYDDGVDNNNRMLWTYSTGSTVFYYLGSYTQLMAGYDSTMTIPVGYYSADKSTIMLTDRWYSIESILTFNYAGANNPLSEAELVLDTNIGGLGNIYGVVDGYTGFDNIAANKISENDDTYEKYTFVVDNEIILPNAKEIYRRGYTLVGYTISKEGVVNDKYISLTEVPNMNVYINSDKKGDRIFNVDGLYGVVTITPEWEATEYDAVANASNEYNVETNESAEVKMVLNEMYSDSAFNLAIYLDGYKLDENGQYRYAEGIYEIKITAEEMKNMFNNSDMFIKPLLEGTNGADIRSLYYIEDLTNQLPLAQLQVSKLGNGEYSISFSNLKSTVRDIVLEDTSYSLVENTILYHESGKSDLSDINENDFDPSTWYLVSDNEDIAKVAEYNKKQANKIHYVIINVDGDGNISDTAYGKYVVLDMLNRTNDGYAVVMTIDFNAKTGVDIDELLSSTTEMTAYDKWLLSRAMNDGVRGEIFRNIDTFYTTKHAEKHTLSIDVKDKYKNVWANSVITLGDVSIENRTNSEYQTNDNTSYNMIFNPQKINLNVTFSRMTDANGNKITGDAVDFVKYQIITNTSQIITNTTNINLHDISGNTDINNVYPIYTSSSIQSEMVAEHSAIAVPYMSSMLVRVDFSGKYADFEAKLIQHDANNIHSDYSDMLNKLFPSLDFKSNTTILFDENYNIYFLIKLDKNASKDIYLTEYKNSLEGIVTQYTNTINNLAGNVYELKEGGTQLSTTWATIEVGGDSGNVFDSISTDTIAYGKTTIYTFKMNENYDNSSNDVYPEMNITISGESGIDNKILNINSKVFSYGEMTIEYKKVGVNYVLTITSQNANITIAPTNVYRKYNVLTSIKDGDGNDITDNILDGASIYNSGTYMYNASVGYVNSGRFEPNIYTYEGSKSSSEYTILNYLDDLNSDEDKTEFNKLFNYPGVVRLKLSDTKLYYTTSGDLYLQLIKDTDNKTYSELVVKSNNTEITKESTKDASDYGKISRDNWFYKVNPINNQELVISAKPNSMKVEINLPEANELPEVSDSQDKALYSDIWVLDYEKYHDKSQDTSWYINWCAVNNTDKISADSNINTTYNSFVIIKLGLEEGVSNKIWELKNGSGVVVATGKYNDEGAVKQDDFYYAYIMLRGENIQGDLTLTVTAEKIGYDITTPEDTDAYNITADKASIIHNTDRNVDISLKPGYNTTFSVKTKSGTNLFSEKFNLVWTWDNKTLEVIGKTYSYDGNKIVSNGKDIAVISAVAKDGDNYKFSILFNSVTENIDIQVESTRIEYTLKENLDQEGNLDQMTAEYSRIYYETINPTSDPEQKGLIENKKYNYGDDLILKFVPNDLYEKSGFVLTINDVQYNVSNKPFIDSIRKDGTNEYIFNGTELKGAGDKKIAGEYTIYELNEGGNCYICVEIKSVIANINISISGMTQNTFQVVKDANDTDSLIDNDATITSISVVEVEEGEEDDATFTLYVPVSYDINSLYFDLKSQRLVGTTNELTNLISAPNQKGTSIEETTLKNVGTITITYTGKDNRSEYNVFQFNIADVKADITLSLVKNCKISVNNTINAVAEGDALVDYEWSYLDGGVVTTNATNKDVVIARGANVVLTLTLKQYVYVDIAKLLEHLGLDITSENISKVDDMTSDDWLNENSITGNNVIYVYYTGDEATDKICGYNGANATGNKVAIVIYNISQPRNITASAFTIIPTYTLSVSANDENFVKKSIEYSYKDMLDNSGNIVFEATIEGQYSQITAEYLNSHKTITDGLDHDIAIANNKLTITISNWYANAEIVFSDIVINKYKLTISGLDLIDGEGVDGIIVYAGDNTIDDDKYKYTITMKYKPYGKDSEIEIYMITITSSTALIHENRSEVASFTSNTVPYYTHGTVISVETSKLSSNAINGEVESVIKGDADSTITSGIRLKQYTISVTANNAITLAGSTSTTESGRTTYTVTRNALDKVVITYTLPSAYLGYYTTKKDDKTILKSDFYTGTEINFVQDENNVNNFIATIDDLGKDYTIEFNDSKMTVDTFMYSTKYLSDNNTLANYALYLSSDYQKIFTFDIQEGGVTLAQLRVQMSNTNYPLTDVRIVDATSGTLSDFVIDFEDIKDSNFIGKYISLPYGTKIVTELTIYKASAVDNIDTTNNNVLKSGTIGSEFAGIEYTYDEGAGTYTAVLYDIDGISANYDKNIAINLVRNVYTVALGDNMAIDGVDVSGKTGTENLYSNGCINYNAVTGEYSIKHGTKVNFLYYSTSNMDIANPTKIADNTRESGDKLYSAVIKRNESEYGSEFEYKDRYVNNKGYEYSLSNIEITDNITFVTQSLPMRYYNSITVGDEMAVNVTFTWTEGDFITYSDYTRDATGVTRGVLDDGKYVYSVDLTNAESNIIYSFSGGLGDLTIVYTKTVTEAYSKGITAKDCVTIDGVGEYTINWSNVSLSEDKESSASFDITAEKMANTKIVVVFEDSVINSYSATLKFNNLTYNGYSLPSGVTTGFEINVDTVSTVSTLSTLSNDHGAYGTIRLTRKACYTKTQIIQLGNYYIEYSGTTWTIYNSNANGSINRDSVKYSGTFDSPVLLELQDTIGMNIYAVVFNGQDIEITLSLTGDIENTINISLNEVDEYTIKINAQDGVFDDIMYVLSDSNKTDNLSTNVFDADATDAEVKNTLRIDKYILIQMTINKDYWNTKFANENIKFDGTGFGTDYSIVEYERVRTLVLLLIYNGTENGSDATITIQGLVKDKYSVTVNTSDAIGSVVGLDEVKDGENLVEYSKEFDACGIDDPNTDSVVENVKEITINMAEEYTMMNGLEIVIKVGSSEPVTYTKDNAGTLEYSVVFGNTNVTTSVGVAIGNGNITITITNLYIDVEISVSSKTNQSEFVIHYIDSNYDVVTTENTALTIGAYTATEIVNLLNNTLGTTLPLGMAYKGVITSDTLGESVYGLDYLYRNYDATYAEIGFGYSDYNADIELEYSTEVQNLYVIYEYTDVEILVGYNYSNTEMNKVSNYNYTTATIKIFESGDAFTGMGPSYQRIIPEPPGVSTMPYTHVSAYIVGSNITGAGVVQYEYDKVNNRFTIDTFAEYINFWKALSNSGNEKKLTAVYAENVIDITFEQIADAITMKDITGLLSGRYNIGYLYINEIGEGTIEGELKDTVVDAETRTMYKCYYTNDGKTILLLMQDNKIWSMCKYTTTTEKGILATYTKADMMYSDLNNVTFVLGRTGNMADVVTYEEVECNNKTVASILDIAWEATHTNDVKMYIDAKQIATIKYVAAMPSGTYIEMLGDIALTGDNDGYMPIYTMAEVLTSSSINTQDASLIYSAYLTGMGDYYYDTSINVTPPTFTTLLVYKDGLTVTGNWNSYITSGKLNVAGLEDHFGENIVDYTFQLVATGGERGSKTAPYIIGNENAWNHIMPAGSLALNSSNHLKYFMIYDISDTDYSDGLSDASLYMPSMQTLAYDFYGNVDGKASTIYRASAEKDETTGEYLVNGNPVFGYIHNEISNMKIENGAVPEITATVPEAWDNDARGWGNLALLSQTASITNITTGKDDQSEKITTTEFNFVSGVVRWIINDKLSGITNNYNIEANNAYGVAGIATTMSLHKAGATEITEISGLTNNGHLTGSWVYGIADIAVSELDNLTVSECYNAGQIDAITGCGVVQISLNKQDIDLIIDDCHNTGPIGASSNVYGVANIYNSTGDVTMTGCDNAGNIGIGNNGTVSGVADITTSGDVTIGALNDTEVDGEKACYNSGSIEVCSDGLSEVYISGVVDINTTGDVNIYGANNIGNINEKPIGVNGVYCSDVCGVVNIACAKDVNMYGCYNSGNILGKNINGVVEIDDSNNIKLSGCWNSGDLTNYNGINSVNGVASIRNSNNVTLEQCVNAGSLHSLTTCGIASIDVNGDVAINDCDNIPDSTDSDSITGNTSSSAYGVAYVTTMGNVNIAWCDNAMAMDGLNVYGVAYVQIKDQQNISGTGTIQYPIVNVSDCCNGGTISLYSNSGDHTDAVGVVEIANAYGFINVKDCRNTGNILIGENLEVIDVDIVGVLKITNEAEDFIHFFAPITNLINTGTLGGSGSKPDVYGVMDLDIAFPCDEIVITDCYNNGTIVDGLYVYGVMSIDSVSDVNISSCGNNIEIVTGEDTGEDIGDDAGVVASTADATETKICGSLIYGVAYINTTGNVIVSGCNNNTVIEGNSVGVTGVIHIESANDVKIDYCYNNAGITAVGDAPLYGVVSIYKANNVTIENCANNATLNRQSGGIYGVAYMENVASASLDNCVNTGSLICTQSQVCGVAAISTTGDVIMKNCHNYMPPNADNPSNVIYGVALILKVNNIYMQNCLFASSAEVLGAVSDIKASGDIVGVVEIRKATGDVELSQCDNHNNLTAGTRVTGCAYISSADGNVTMTECYNAGTIKSSGDAYGVAFVGQADEVNISASYNTGNIEANSTVFGVVYVNGSTHIITGCFNNAILSGYSVYGIYGGTATNSITISNCNNGGSMITQYNYENVSSAGIAYISASGADITMTGCINNASIQPYSDNVGVYSAGIAYITKAENVILTNCDNNGDIKGIGIAGVADITATGNVRLSGCDNTGKIEGTSVSICGVVHINTGGEVVLEDCNNKGDLKVSSAGCAGVVYIERTSEATIKNCTNSGNISVGISTKFVSGVILHKSGQTVTYTNCSNTGTINLDTGCSATVYEEKGEYKY
ncbi:MAG: hypothetical protein E7361_00015 [Clostridiales bacterium]|nr:hypothetical protein [Clostridiales bacterium]